MMDKAEIERLGEKKIFVTDDYELIPVVRDGEIQLKPARVIQAFPFAPLFGRTTIKATA